MSRDASLYFCTEVCKSLNPCANLHVKVQLLLPLSDIEHSATKTEHKSLGRCRFAPSLLNWVGFLRVRAGLRVWLVVVLPLRLCGRASRLRRWFLFDEARRWAVLFFHLLCQDNSAAEACELPKLVLDCL